MTIKVLVTDFDDCLVIGSEAVKDEIWPLAFGDGALAIEPFFKKAQRRFADGAGDRYDIVRETLQAIGKSSETEVDRVCDLFDDILQEEIRDIGMRPEDHAALAFLSSEMPVYLNTATPIHTVRESLRNLDILKYFTGVFGRPDDKCSNMHSILKRQREIGLTTVPREVLFVGDGDGDWKTAQEFGCSFVGIATMRNKWMKEKPFPIIRFFSEVVPYTVQRF